MIVVIRVRTFCHVHERIAVGNLERVGNELSAVIGLSESKVFANKVFVRSNFSAVDFRVVGRNEQNPHHPQSALQCQGGGDFAHGKGKGKQRDQRQVEPKSNREKRASCTSSALPTSPTPRLAMQPAGAHTMACFECCEVLLIVGKAFQSTPV